ncbi:MAG: hypothetical protein ACI9G9_000948 [Psychromonas sp.]|jgi:hypothetical protein
MRSFKLILTCIVSFTVLLSCRKTEFQRLKKYKYELIEYSLNGDVRNEDINKFSFSVDNIGFEDIVIETTASYGLLDGDSLAVALGYSGVRISKEFIITMDQNLPSASKTYKRSRTWSGKINISEAIEDFKYISITSGGIFYIDHKKDEFKMQIDRQINGYNEDKTFRSEVFIFKRTKL